MKFKKIKSKKEILKTDREDGYLIDANEKEVRGVVDFLKGKDKIIAVLGRDDEFNRRMLEKTKINYLVSPERWHFKDGLKQRDSGLNHVLAKIAKGKGIGIMIDFSALMKMDKMEKARTIARIMQNVRICRRAGCKIKIADFNNGDEKVLKSFGFSLGMSSEQVRDAMNFRLRVVLF